MQKKSLFVNGNLKTHLKPDENGEVSPLLSLEKYVM